MRVEQLPARLWRRRYLRILASRRHRREAADARRIRREPIPAAYDRWLRYRAVGGHCCRPYAVSLPDGLPFTRGPRADVVIIDDPVRAADLPSHLQAAVSAWWADVEQREKHRPEGGS